MDCRHANLFGRAATALKEMAHPPVRSTSHANLFGRALTVVGLPVVWFSPHHFAWTILRQNGPDNLALCCMDYRSERTALITSHHVAWTVAPTETALITSHDVARTIAPTEMALITSHFVAWTVAPTETALIASHCWKVGGLPAVWSVLAPPTANPKDKDDPGQVRPRPPRLSVVYLVSLVSVISVLSLISLISLISCSWTF